MKLAPGRTRISVYVDLEVKLEIEELAKEEKRSISACIEVLCEEAIKARRRRLAA